MLNHTRNNLALFTVWFWVVKQKLAVEAEAFCENWSLIKVCGNIIIHFGKKLFRKDFCFE